MKSEKEIKEYLAKVEKEYINCQKSNQKYLKTVASDIINALRWALDMPTFDYNRLDEYEVIMTDKNLSRALFGESEEK